MKSITASLPLWLAALVAATSPAAPPILSGVPPAGGPAPAPDLSSCPNLHKLIHARGSESGPEHTEPRYFSLVAQGASGPTNVVGQIADGQNRVGGGVNMGQYYIMDGKIMDSHNRTCILTPLVNQWQCDEGGAGK